MPKGPPSPRAHMWATLRQAGGGARGLGGLGGLGAAGEARTAPGLRICD